MKNPLEQRVGVGLTLLEITSLLVLLNDKELVKHRYPPSMVKQFNEMTKMFTKIVDVEIKGDSNG
jgi:hypothetical protein